MLEPAQSLSTQTGALPFTGSEIVAAGLTVASPSWAVPIECVVVWLAEPPPFEPVAAELPPVELWFVLELAQSLRTQIGALPLTGSETAAAGLTVELPIWAVPIECVVVWLAEPPPCEPVEAELPPFEPCWREPLLQSLSTHTGALPLIGSETVAAGLTVASPSWAVPIECVAVCGDEPPPFEPEEAFAPPFEPCSVLWPLQSEATQTGAFAFTGADTDRAGSTLAEPAWTLPADWPTDCEPPEPLPLVEALLPPPPELWSVELPLQSEATQTGALAFTGAEAETAGSTLACPACTLAADWSTDCEPPEPLLLVEALPPPELWSMEPPLQSEATQTGAFALTGAEAETAGSTLVEPAWMLPADWSTDCCVLVELVLLLAELEADEVCSVELPLVSEATLTGVLVFTGAVALVPGLTVADDACTVASDWEAVWVVVPVGSAEEPPSSASAGEAPRANATSETASAQIRFMIA